MWTVRERVRRLVLHQRGGGRGVAPCRARKDDGATLRDLAEVFPTLKELRLANPPGAEKFLLGTKKQSENWPVASLIDGYLDSLP